MDELSASNRLLEMVYEAMHKRPDGAESRDGLARSRRPMDLSVDEEDESEPGDWPPDAAGEQDHIRTEIAGLNR